MKGPIGATLRRVSNPLAVRQGAGGQGELREGRLPQIRESRDGPACKL